MEFKKIRRQLQRKRDIKIELCVELSLLRLSHVGHVVQIGGVLLSLCFKASLSAKFLLRPWQTRTLLRTQYCRHKCFPVCPRAQHLLRTQTQKMCLILLRNILCPQQVFPSLHSMETQYSFCVPRVCAPKKHHEQQCVFVCQGLSGN